MCACTGVEVGVCWVLLETQEDFASGATLAQTGVGQLHNRQHSQMVHRLTGG